MPAKKRNFSLTLFHYKRRFIISISIFSGFIFILLWVLIFGVSTAVKTVEKLKEMIETNFLNSEEVLQFKNAEIFIIKPKLLQNYIIEASAKENISSKISLKGSLDYSVRNLKADIFLVEKGAKKESWSEKYLITSKIANITNTTITLENNVEGYFTSQINNELNGSIGYADKVTFFISENIAKGKKIFIKSPTSYFEADTFEVFLNQDLAKFSQNIIYNSPDYKIYSQTLDAIFFDGKVHTLIFKKNVRFYEKGGNHTIAHGDIAIYEATSSKITMKDNVSIKTKQNNLNIKADNFEYNEKTKQGSFKNSEKRLKKQRVEIELDV